MSEILWYCPVPQGSPISQTFSQHPGYGKGVDFVVPNGTPVKAMRGGRVSQVVDKYKVNEQDPDYGYGNRVVIDHGNIDGKVYVSYCTHLYPGIRTKVGDLVDTGQIIANSDNNGLSTGPHLHAETRRNNVPFDWWPYVSYSVQEVDQGQIEFTVPTFPAPVRGKVVAEKGLNIRQRPLVTSRDVGDLAFGTILDIFSGTWVGTDYWIKIGYDQYCAAYYQGNTWMLFL